MGKEKETLTVRRHDRVRCEFSASILIDPDQAEQIVFSRAVGDIDGRLPIRIVDCSLGGLGLDVGVYLPKGSVLEVRDQERGCVFRVRVMRGAMKDRAPRYYLGTSFLDDASRAAVEVLLKDARTAGGEAA